MGIHNALPALRDLYNEQSAAFISNVGNLVEPKTKQSWRWGKTCVGMFSHADQQAGAQTLMCQTKGSGPKGAGGRIADALSHGEEEFSTASYSMRGNSAWSPGRSTRAKLLDSGTSSSNNGWMDYERSRETVINLTSQEFRNAYAEVFVRAFQISLDTTQNFQRLIDSASTINEQYRTNSDLKRQLHMVAKMIRVHESLGSERDFFFTNIGGWDMHSMMKQNLNNKFTDINEALEDFVGEMKAQDAWNNVILMTSSEFARTLDTNGGGSDHAWAGNHFIIGGSLNGGRVFNQFPATLAEGNSRDLGRGRMIPGYPWESVMIPIAQWMGVVESQIGVTFENAFNFNDSHIIAKESLFSA